MFTVSILFIIITWYSWMSLKPNLLISSPMRELEAGLGLEDSDLVGVWDLMERSSASAMSSSSSMLSPMLSSSSSSSTEPELMAATDPGLSALSSVSAASMTASSVSVSALARDFLPVSECSDCSVDRDRLCGVGDLLVELQTKVREGLRIRSPVFFLIVIGKALYLLFLSGLRE